MLIGIGVYLLIGVVVTLCFAVNDSRRSRRMYQAGEEITPSFPSMAEPLAFSFLILLCVIAWPLDLYEVWRRR